MCYICTTLRHLEVFKYIFLLGFYYFKEKIYRTAVDTNCNLVTNVEHSPNFTTLHQIHVPPSGYHINLMFSWWRIFFSTVLGVHNKMERVLALKVLFTPSSITIQVASKPQIFVQWLSRSWNNPSKALLSVDITVKASWAYWIISVSKHLDWLPTIQWVWMGQSCFKRANKDLHTSLQIS